MGKASRDKGKRGEREARDQVVKHWNSPGCVRSAQVSGLFSSDLMYGPPGLHLEVKRYAKIGCMRFMEQARQDSRDEDVPTVLMREDNGEWCVMVPMDRSVDFAQKILAALTDD